MDLLGGGGWRICCQKTAIAVVAQKTISMVPGAARGLRKALIQGAKVTIDPPVVTEDPQPFPWVNERLSPLDAGSVFEQIPFLVRKRYH
jgi:hypothetical protein